MDRYERKIWRGKKCEVMYKLLSKICSQCSSVFKSSSRSWGMGEGWVPHTWCWGAWTLPAFLQALWARTTDGSYPGIPLKGEKMDLCVYCLSQLFRGRENWKQPEWFKQHLFFKWNHLCKLCCQHFNNVLKPLKSNLER